MKRSFAQRGAFVEVSTTVEKEKLTSQQVLANLRNFDAEIGKIQENYMNLEKQKADLDKGTEHYIGLRKQMAKFEKWALEVQESKVKALMAEVKDECEQSVRDSYIPDASLSTEENQRQMYRQLQQKMATHSKVAGELDQEIVKKHFFVESNIVNPF